MNQVCKVLVLLFITSTTIVCQNTFVKTHNFLEAPYTQFHNIIIAAADTIVVTGSSRDINGNNNHGIYIAKLDTFGNILNEKVIAPEDDFFMHEHQYGVIKSSDGGYALVGQYLIKNNGVLIKTDVNFNIEYVSEFEENNDEILNVRNEQIIEMGNHFFIVARKQHVSDGIEHSHLMKISKNGNLIWEQNLESKNIRAYFNIEKSKTEEKAILYGTKRYLNNQNIELQKFYSIIDTSGSEIFNIEVDQGENESINFNSVYFDENDILVGGEYFQYFTNPFTYFAQPFIHKIDNQLNIHWEYIYGEQKIEGELVEFRDIEKCIDGNFISPLNYYLQGSFAISSPNILIKYSSEGKKIWERHDSILDFGFGVYNQPNKSIVLPSGSIVTCGTATQIDSVGSKEFGYLIKVDNNGCLIGNCPEILTKNVNPQNYESIEIDVYPNPSNGMITIKSNEYIDRAILTNSNGIIVFDEQELGLLKNVDFTFLPAGIYPIKLFIGDKKIMKKIVVFRQ